MSYKVFTIAYFDKQLKRLIKKYPSLKKEFASLTTSLAQNAEQGTPIGNDCFKIRLAIESKQKGKSGGARVITYILYIKSEIYLLSIYDKSEEEAISDKIIETLRKQVNE